MTVPTTSSLPRVIFRGFKDGSAINIATPSEALPIRLPLFITYTPWGEENRARYVSGDTLNTLYGSETIDPLSPFFTHQSQFLRSHLSNTGKALLLGMRAPDAKQASGRLALDIVADDIPLYERNLDGSLKLDAQGARIPTGDTAAGFRAQWKVIAIPDGPDGQNTYGNGQKAAGALVAGDGSLSELTPVADMLARFRGAKGSNLGFRMYAPTTKSTDPLITDLEDVLKAWPYRLQVIQRADSSSTASFVPTLMSESYVDFTFKKGAVDRSTRTNYSFDRAILPKYESRDETKFVGFGPFEKVMSYDANVTDLLTKLSAAEAAFTGTAFEDIHLFNFLSGVDENNNPYQTFVIEGPTEGGLYLNEVSNHFMKGGTDGTMGAAAYNQQIDDLLTNLENSPIPFKSIARMPYDSVWDTGFPTATKVKFGKFHSIRPDVYIHACTQDVSRPINTPSIDSSVAVTLRSAFRAMLESAEFATKAARFALVANAGYLIEDEHEGLTPFLEYLCILGARYMSAETGDMNREFTFGRGEKTVITRYRDTNVVYRDPAAKVNDWNNGLNMADYYDMSRSFWPGVQSIYEDHTSVLHSYMNVQICCNVTRLGHITWRELAGDDQLRDDAFLDEVQLRMVRKTSNPDRYDDRVDVTPRAYYTALDDQLGTHWHLDVDVAAEGLRGVQSMSIIAQRRRNEESDNV